MTIERKFSNVGTRNEVRARVVTKFLSEEPGRGKWKWQVLLLQFRQIKLHHHPKKTTPPFSSIFYMILRQGRTHGHDAAACPAML